MVALVQRVRKLEKKVADRSQTAQLDDRVVYQPSAEDLAEAVAILVECGVVREVGSKQCLLSNEKAIASVTTAPLRTSGCGGYPHLQRTQHLMR